MCMKQLLISPSFSSSLLAPCFPSRFGYAEFASAQEAKKARNNMTDQELDGRTVRIDYATPRGQGGGRGTPRGGRGTPRGAPRGGGRGGEWL